MNVREFIIEFAKDANEYGGNRRALLLLANERAVNFLFELLLDSPGEFIVQNHRRQIVHPTGANLKVYSASEPHHKYRLSGLQVQLLGYDETINAEVFEFAFTRVRSTDGSPLATWALVD